MIKRLKKKFRKIKKGYKKMYVSCFKYTYAPFTETLIGRIKAEDVFVFNEINVTSGDGTYIAGGVVGEEVNIITDFNNPENL